MYRDDLVTKPSRTIPVFWEIPGGTHVCGCICLFNPQTMPHRIPPPPPQATRVDILLGLGVPPCEGGREGVVRTCVFAAGGGGERGNGRWANAVPADWEDAIVQCGACVSPTSVYKQYLFLRSRLILACGAPLRDARALADSVCICAGWCGSCTPFA